MAVISDCNEPGTTVISDCWASYLDLGAHGYTHHTVNQTSRFVDERTAAHTNTIESTWHFVKAFLNPYNRTEVHFPSRPVHVRRTMWTSSLNSCTLLQTRTGAYRLLPTGIVPRDSPLPRNHHYMRRRTSQVSTSFRHYSWRVSHLCFAVPTIQDQFQIKLYNLFDMTSGIWIVSRFRKAKFYFGL
jgi:hypothetical protein